MCVHVTVGIRVWNAFPLAVSFHADFTLPFLFSHHIGSSSNHLNNRLFASHKDLCVSLFPSTRIISPHSFPFMFDLATLKCKIKISVPVEREAMQRVSRIYMWDGETSDKKITRTKRAHGARESLRRNSTLQLSRSHRLCIVHRCICIPPLQTGASFASASGHGGSVKAELQRAPVAIKGAYCVGETIHHSFIQEPDK